MYLSSYSSKQTTKSAIIYQEFWGINNVKVKQKKKRKLTKGMNK